MEKAVAKQQGRVVMAKVDIDEHTDLAIEYGVRVGGANSWCDSVRRCGRSKLCLICLTKYTLKPYHTA